MERDSFIAGGRLAKSNSGNEAPSAGEKSDETAASSVGGGGAIVREQDRFMPIANVIRIMRRVLPTHAKIADDAKETVQECVSEYISFVTSEANERCQQEQRKTITAEDLLWAMSKLGFDDYVQPLSLYLQRYREAEGDSRGGSLSMPLKRATSDAGLFHHHSFQSPSFHHASGNDPHPHNLQFYYHHYPPPPPGFFIGSAGTSSGGEGDQMQGRYFRDGAAQPQGTSAQGVPKDGFHPFAPYR